MTLTARLSARDLPSAPGIQAAVLRECLARAVGRHRVAELLGLDRVSGIIQLGLGVASLFVSGLAAGVGFLVSETALGAAKRPAG